MPRADPLHVSSPWPPHGRTRVWMHLGQLAWTFSEHQFLSFKTEICPLVLLTPGVAMG